MVEYKIINEPWNFYKIEDGTILKTRFILEMAHFEKTLEQMAREALESGKKIGSDMGIGTGVNLSHRLLIQVSSPDDLMGEPSDVKDVNLKDHVILEDMKFTTKKENLFEYHFENGFILKGKVVLINVDKTSFFNNNGCPIYLIDNNIDAQLRVPTKTRDKILAKIKQT